MFNISLFNIVLFLTPIISFLKLSFNELKNKGLLFVMLFSIIYIIERSYFLIIIDIIFNSVAIAHPIFFKNNLFYKFIPLISSFAYWYVASRITRDNTPKIVFITLGILVEFFFQFFVSFFLIALAIYFFE